MMACRVVSILLPLAASKQLPASTWLGAQCDNMIQYSSRTSWDNVEHGKMEMEMKSRGDEVDS